MTHTELLDYLREHEEYWTSLRANPWAKLPAFNALRAVVELHKPYGSESKGFICEFCMERALPAWVYPCPTIQAIEKELK